MDFFFLLLVLGVFLLVSMTSIVIGTVVNSGSSPTAVARVHENGCQFVELLPATNDDHGGVIVDMKEAVEPLTFATLLRASVSHWKQQVCCESIDRLKLLLINIRVFRPG